MRVRFSLAEGQKKIRHVLSQIPAVNRSAIHHNETIFEIEFSPPLCARFVTEPEQLQISAARHDFMDYIPAAQAFPLTNDRPNAFSQGHDAIRRRQRATLHTLCYSIRKRAFATMFR